MAAFEPRTHCLDIGIALGSPVSLDYCAKAPFKFNGRIERVHVKYIDTKWGVRTGLRTA